MWTHQIFVLALCVGGPLFAFTGNPWLNSPFESEIFLSYQYQYYPSVADQPGSKQSSHNNFFQGDLSVAFLDQWDIQGEIELDQTTKKRFGFESIGIQARKLWFNDIAGDPISLMMGGNLRIVPHGRLSDPATPYHKVGNIEATLALGKEWNNYYDWFLRTYALFAIGQANRGYPWVRANYHLSGKYRERWEWDISALGYFGMGKETSVSARSFKGYASIRHQSVDIELTLFYLLGFWGKLGLTASHRVYAKAYPRAATGIEVSYTLPFSLF